MTEQRLDLGLTAPASGCGSHACACGSTASEDSTPASADIVAQVDVAGMTCSHCVRAVTEELSALEGVSAVDVDLVPGGASRVIVHGSAPLADDAVRAAVAEAGYALAD